MLDTPLLSRPLPPATLRATTGNEKPGRQPAADAADAPVQPADPALHRPTVFEDLPAELIGQVAADVFRASAHDLRSRVDSLACNQRLRATLTDELHAGEVLRTIQSSRDLPALCAALGDIQGVFPPLRQGCLNAALHLLPRLALPRVLPEALWTPLDALLRSVASDPEDALPLRLASALRQHSRYEVGHIERVLGLLDSRSPPGPRLSATLLRWAAQLQVLPAFTSMGVEVLRQRLLDASPPSFRPRMRQVCDFSALVRSRDRKSVV